MFYMLPMQESFDFAAGIAADDLAFMRRSLARFFGRFERLKRRPPIWQLVRSLIGAQTYDRIAEAALKRLMWRWPDPAGIAGADADTVLRYIDDVTHAKAKAEHLVATMRWIGRARPSYDLAFLRQWPVRDALDWLERFPGVGPKVAAATLNASTLGMPVFIVDSHVHRILLRFGFIGPHASAEQGRDAVTAAAGALDADDLLELFAQMKRLGQTRCRPFRAGCASCPLSERCQKKIDLGVPRLAAAEEHSVTGYSSPPAPIVNASFQSQRSVLTVE